MGHKNIQNLPEFWVIWRNLLSFSLFRLEFVAKCPNDKPDVALIVENCLYLSTVATPTLLFKRNNIKQCAFVVNIYGWRVVWFKVKCLKLLSVCCMNNWLLTAEPVATYFLPMHSNIDFASLICGVISFTQKHYTRLSNNFFYSMEHSKHQHPMFYI